jgi:Protein of unknown function (DUF1475)
MDGVPQAACLRRWVPMRLFLILLFSAVFVCMVVVTVRSSLAVSLWDAWPSYAANPWAIATLYDAYCGLVTFYVWVGYKERTLLARIVWFILIMTLGNIAMSAYVLLQLFRLPPDQPVESILWSKAA